MRFAQSAASRIVAGTLGAYAVAALLTVALSLLLAKMGVSRVEAVTGATLASFALFAVAAMAVFHARDAVRAWVGLLAAGLPAGLLILLLSGAPA